MFSPAYLDHSDAQAGQRMDVQNHRTLQREDSDSGKRHLGAPIHE